MSSEHIRVTVHSEALKLGRVPHPKIPTLKEMLKDSSLVNDAAIKGITEIGYRLTYAQDQALFVVQQLLDASDYEGNDKPIKPTRGSIYRFTGNLPVLNVKTSELLELYGVKQLLSAGRKVYSPQSRRVAINALKDLGTNEYLLAYEKSARPKTRRKVSVEVIAPLLNLEWINGGRRVRIIPNPILVDQIDSYCILKPVDFYAIVPDKDQFKVRFLEFLLYHAEMNRRTSRRKQDHRWEIRLTSDAVAWALRLDAMISARKKSALRRKLTELYGFGVKTGYLESYELEQPGTKRRKVDVLRLNMTTFKYLVPSGAKSSTKRSKV
jgi:hypothetical protein